MKLKVYDLDLDCVSEQSLNLFEVNTRYLLKDSISQAYLHSICIFTCVCTHMYHNLQAYWSGGAGREVV